MEFLFDCLTRQLMSEMSSLSSKQNSPLLTRKVSFKNLLMNENKRIYNPPIKIIECVGAQAQDESKRNVETPQKTCNGRNFQCQKFSVIYSPSEEILSVNGKNRPVASLPVVDFRSQPREMPLPKLLNTYLQVFLSVFWFSFPSREV